MFGVGFLEFNVGNAITIGAGLIAWAVSWGKWQADMGILKSAVAEQGKRIEEIDRTGGLVTERDRMSLHEMVRDHEGRLRKLEALDGKIEIIARDIAWIRENAAKLARDRNN